MAARVICLSRAIYADADEVAALVGAELEFRCVDEEIVVRAAESKHIEPEQVASAEKRKSFFEQVFEDISIGAGMAGMAGYGSGYVPDADLMPVRGYQLRALIRQAVVETAAEGSVVIVAHAASYALAERDGVLRVLVTGSALARARRLAAAKGTTPAAAAVEIRRSDEARANYLKRFYEVDRELPEHYDLCLSTDAMTPAQAASVIVHCARAMHTA